MTSVKVHANTVSRWLALTVTGAGSSLDPWRREAGSLHGVGGLFETAEEDRGGPTPSPDRALPREPRRALEAAWYLATPPE